MAEDNRIDCTVEQLLGPDFVWIGSDGSMYVGDTRGMRTTPMAAIVG